MSAKQVSLIEASEQELRSFAEIVLGLEVDEGDSAESLRAVIAASGWTREEIPSLTPTGRSRGEAPAPSIEIQGAVVKNDKGQDCRKIHIHTKDEQGGDMPIQVGVNGRMMLIPRGQDVLVPLPYVKILENARMDVYAEYSEGLGGLKRPRQVHTYPFSYV